MPIARPVTPRPANEPPTRGCRKIDADGLLLVSADDRTVRSRHVPADGVKAFARLGGIRTPNLLIRRDLRTVFVVRSCDVLPAQRQI